MRRSIVMMALAAAVSVSAVTASGAWAADATAKQEGRARVIFQVSDNDPMKWNLALNNARNVQADLGKDNVDVEIVAYGPGIGMLKGDSKTEPRITAALTDGVKVVACENTMKGQKLTTADMIPGIAYVPAGVVELMQRQSQGWSYIRP